MFFFIHLYAKSIIANILVAVTSISDKNLIELYICITARSCQLPVVRL